MQIWAVEGIPEVVAGDDIAALILAGVISTGSITGGIEDGDIVVVTSKIVSKAEGRSVKAEDREEAITSQTVRVVATRGSTRIVENPLGLVMAAAGVDASNAPDGIVLLLPEDPDASARAIRNALGKNVGVIISDTIGRPWRQGVTDIAIGAAGIHVLDDLRGTLDAGGKQLEGTIVALADELAAAADLVRGKANNLPVAIIRGMSHLLGEGSASELIRPANEDMFRLGSTEAWNEGYEAGLQAGGGRGDSGEASGAE
jgi:coenzyme F420-0:L-glutamate ligase/coenzyme F420-1:gamma-L-glutamate ligase